MKSLSEAGRTLLPQSRLRLSTRQNLRRKIVKAPSHQLRTVSKTRRTLLERTAIYNLFLVEWKWRRNTLCTEFIFICSLCTNSEFIGTEKYNKVKRRSSVTMPSAFLMPIFALIFVFPHYDVQYVYLCTEAVDRDVNKYVVYL